jgi:deoxyxylulose-5-phosphate synthase
MEFLAAALALSVVLAGPALAAPGYGVKPIDGAALEGAAQAAGGILVTVEDHYAEGGFGDVVLVAAAGKNVSVVKLPWGASGAAGRPASCWSATGSAVEPSPSACARS